PTELNVLCSAPETSVPSNPPGGIEPRTSGICQSASKAGSDNTSSAYPASLIRAESRARLRNQRSPSAKIPIGNRNAGYPNPWNIKSALYAPAGPIQFRAGWVSGGAAETLSEVSCG